MSDKIVGFRLVILTVLFLFTLAVWFPVISFSSETSELLTIRFLDVGQGDSIHIETPDGYEMLIDGGSSASVLRKFSEGRPFFDKYIDIMVATHPDTDHVGGLVDILDRYNVGMIIQGEVEHSAPASLAFVRSAVAEGSQIIIAQSGQVIQLGASTTVRILSPAGDTTNWKSNNASIIIQVIYDDVEFMLTGDAPSSIENYLVSLYGDSLESEVLKLGHHGSKTSTSELFLDAVDSDFAVVSAGKDNRYNHPHREVVDRVIEKDIEILSTAVSGTIVFQSDGKEVWVK